MYNYKSHESQDGSHFFIKTQNDGIVRVSLFNPNEDYANQFLEKNTQHLIVYNYTDTTLSYSEGVSVCETISKIVYDHLAYNERVIKIEVKPSCGKDNHIKRFLDDRPDDVKGYVLQTDEHSIYYIFNKNKIDATDLLYNLNQEYKE